MSDNYIKQAVKYIGRSKLSKAVGVSQPAIIRWEDNGRLPRTEWTGETNYAEIIVKLSKGKFKKKELLKI